MFPPGESRKLTGLYVTFGALFAVLILAIVGVAFFHVAEGLFTSFGGYVLGGGTAHQGAQMMADRSPNYPNTPVVGGFAIPAQPGLAPATNPNPGILRISRAERYAGAALVAAGAVVLTLSSISLLNLA